jgi:protein subunit release factor A
LSRQIDDLNTLYEFFKSGDATEQEVNEEFLSASKKLEQIEFKNMLRGEEDHLNCILQINAGAGGTESCDWASMLMRMYLMWAEKQGFKIKELDYNGGDVAGIKGCARRRADDAGDMEDGGRAFAEASEGGGIGEVTLDPDDIRLFGL